MQQPQILSFGADEKLAESLDGWMRELGAWARPVQHARAACRLLAEGDPAILVLKLGRDLEQELALIAQAADAAPHARILVLAEAHHPSVAGLMWDLGATCVLVPPASHAALRATLTKLLQKPARPDDGQARR